jgi:hypothetical protein
VIDGGWAIGEETIIEVEAGAITRAMYEAHVLRDFVAELNDSLSHFVALGTVEKITDPVGLTGIRITINKRIPTITAVDVPKPGTFRATGVFTTTSYTANEAQWLLRTRSNWNS